MGAVGTRNRVDTFAWRRERTEFIVHHATLLAICKEIERRYRRYPNLSYDKVIRIMLSDKRTWGERMATEHPSTDPAAELRYWRRTFFRWKSRKRLTKQPCQPHFGDKGQGSCEINLKFINDGKDEQTNENIEIPKTSPTDAKENSVTLQEKSENVSHETAAIPLRRKQKENTT